MPSGPLHFDATIADTGYQSRLDAMERRMIGAILISVGNLLFSVVCLLVYLRVGQYTGKKNGREATLQQRHYEAADHKALEDNARRIELILATRKGLNK